MQLPPPSPPFRRLSENISNIISRGEKLDLVMERTEQLEANALVFRNHSVRLKKIMRRKNMMYKLALVGTVLLAMLVLGMSACGPDFGQCRNASSGTGGE